MSGDHAVTLVPEIVKREPCEPISMIVLPLTLAMPGNIPGLGDALSPFLVGIVPWLPENQ